MKRLFILIFLFGIFFSQSSYAYDWPHIQPKLIGPNTYILEHGAHDEPAEVSRGYHNNPSFVITNDGVVVIDTGSSYEIGKMILRRIESITTKPVTHIFTTHFHGDHWLSNHALLEKYPNAKTIAHPELIKLLEEGEDKVWFDRFSKRLGDDFTGTKAIIPNTPAKNQTYQIGGLNFQVIIFDKAHTTTDLMVYVIDEEVLFTGDIINNKHFSFMGHGNFKGAYEATQKALSINPNHVVVGHGKSGKSDLIKSFLKFYQHLTTIVQDMYEQDMLDYEMKPKVIESLSEFKDWSGFENQIGPYISQIILELENESF